MDNTSSSSPQVGLGQADLVVEELVEGGMTRLAAFYYSRAARRASGRSGRCAPPTSASCRAARTWSPVAPPAVTLGRVNKAGIPFVTEGAKGIYRDIARSAPYNLFVRPRR